MSGSELHQHTPCSLPGQARGCKTFFLVAQQLYMSSCFFSVPSDPHTNSEVHIHTQKQDETKHNINGFDKAKSAAQLLYGPVLVISFNGSRIMICLFLLQAQLT